MKVLITGAAGVLGKAVTALLEEEPGVQLRLTDVAPLETPHDFIQADLIEAEAVTPLCDGIDQVMHIASIHPWKQYTPKQYIDCNVTGTYNILQAAAESPVQRVILTSSIAAMGMASDPSCLLPWDESKPCAPDGHIYSVTKHAGEQFCDMFRKMGAFSTIALRPGTFIPRDENEPSFGVGLLAQWLHLSDVASAHLLALRSRIENEAFIITSKVPFVREDHEMLLSDARSVVLKYFPRAAELEQRGIKLPERIGLCYDISKAERLLGYCPKVTFETWMEQTLDT